MHYPDVSWWGESDHTQSRKISQLQADLAHTHAQARAQQRRLRSELGKVRGTLEQRLDRITASFDAFVELSDVRTLLVPFADYGLVRHQVRRLLEDPGADALPLDGDTTPDYWLVPAARGLRAVLDGASSAAQRYFAEAAQHDPTRSGVFALLSAATAGPAPGPDRAAPLADWILPSLLPGLSDEVARHERALWLLAADGLLGPGAREHVRRCAATAVERHPRAAQAASVWLAPGSGRTTHRKQRILSGIESATRPLEAAERLAALRSRLADELPPAADPLPDGTAETEYATGTLRLLVEEGGPEEAPLIRRAAQLRQVVESSGAGSADAPAPSWDEPAGDLLDLLAADSDGAKTPSARRSFAAGVLAPQILAGAAELAEQAGQPVKDEASFTYLRHRITVSSHGADPDGLAAAERALAAFHEPGAGPVRAILTAAAAAVLLILALLTPATTLLAVLAVLAGAASGWMLFDTRRSNTERKALLESGRKRLHQQAEQAVHAWRELHGRAAQAAADAERDLASVRALLART